MSNFYNTWHGYLIYFTDRHWADGSLKERGVIQVRRGGMTIKTFFYNTSSVESEDIAQRRANEWADKHYNNSVPSTAAAFKIKHISYRSEPLNH